MIRKKGFRIGENALTGQSIVLSDEDLKRHAAIIGGTGRGKSKLLESIARHHMVAGHGMMVLDPHGTLYDDLLAFATSAGMKDRMVLLNANDP